MTSAAGARRKEIPPRLRRALHHLVAGACAALLAGCHALASLARPEGDGGWSATQRQEELARRAAAAGVEFAAPAPAPAPPPNGRKPQAIAGKLDLPTALALAVSGNRRIAVAEQQVATARERFYDTRGRLLPATVGTARYTIYTEPLHTTVNLPGGILPSPPTVTIRDADFGTVNATLSFPIDLSGEIRHALAAAQAGYRGERARLWATTLAQQVEVVRAYYEVLEAQRLREVTEQTIAVDRQQLADAQSQFDNGRLTKNELLVVQVTLRNAEQELVRRDLTIDEARWALNEAIGTAVNARSELVDVRDRPQVPAVDQALQLAYAHNPVLTSLVEEQQRLEENLRSLERSRFPRFSGGGAIDYSTSDVPLPQRLESGFAGFIWDLGTDTRREAQIAEARIAAEQNRITIESEMREIEQAVRTAQGATQERLSALSAAEAAVGQAEENLRIRQQQFSAGRAQSEDVLNAEALLAQQRATLATALYQAHTRRAELQELIGLPLEGQEAASAPADAAPPADLPARRSVAEASMEPR